MNNLNILNKKAIKEILKLIKSQWDSKIEIDYAFLQDKLNNIYIAKREFASFPLEKIRMHKIGLNIGQIYNNQFIATIEGSQLIGPKAKKNILKITKHESRDWLRGENLTSKEKLKGLVLIKHNNDFFGTGKINNKEVINLLPKSRRLKSSD